MSHPELSDLLAHRLVGDEDAADAPEQDPRLKDSPPAAHCEACAAEDAALDDVLEAIALPEVEAAPPWEQLEALLAVDEVTTGARALGEAGERAAPAAPAAPTPSGFAARRAANPSSSDSVPRGFVRTGMVLASMAAVALVAAAIHARMDGGPEQPSASSPPLVAAAPDLPREETIVGHLEAGRLEEARSEARRLKATRRSTEQLVPKTLEQWASRRLEGVAFDWKDRQLLVILREHGSSERLLGWAKGQAARLEVAEQAESVLTKVESGLADVAKHEEASRFEPALEQLEKLQALIASAPKEAPASARLLELGEKVRSERVRLALAWANRLAEDKNPRLEKALEVLRLAEKTASSEDVGKITGLRDRYERTWKDTQSLLRGREAIDGGDLALAVECLKQVHPRSSCYVQASTLLRWAEALLGAHQAYREGDAKRAFQLLGDAFNVAGIGEADRAKVRELHTAWSRVVRAYERGLKLKDEGRYKEGIKEFEQVLRLEPDRTVAFRVRAEDEIQLVRSVTRRTHQRKGENMRDALAKQNWRLFHTWALEISRDKNRAQSEIDWIYTAIADANKQHKLYKRCYRAFQRDQEQEFVWCDSVLQVLANWLPESDPDRVKARELWKKIKARIKRWEELGSDGKSETTDEQPPAKTGEEAPEKTGAKDER